MEGEVLLFANQEFLAILMSGFQFMLATYCFLFLFLTVVTDLTQTTLKLVGFGAGLCMEMLGILPRNEIFS